MISHRTKRCAKSIEDGILAYATAGAFQEMKVQKYFEELIKKCTVCIPTIFISSRQHSCKIIFSETILSVEECNTIEMELKKFKKLLITKLPEQKYISYSFIF